MGGWLVSYAATIYRLESLEGNKDPAILKAI